MPRRIAVVTGSRAEYGLLRPLLARLRASDGCTLQLVVTGMHLSTEFGSTHRAIEDDGFTIDARVDMLLASDEPRAIVKSVGLGTIGFADAYARLSPDIVVVLGDRFEILAAAQAALLMRVPLAHLHGGEISEGAIDDSMRHALTKMASLHFVAAEEYRRRVIQMGEQPTHVFDFGAPGLDAIREMPLLGRDELATELGLALDGSVFLVTYHPATLGDTDAVAATKSLCRALDHFSDARIVVTKPNADASGRAIAHTLDAWAETRKDRVVVRTSLGQQRYFSAMGLARVVVGNSSSGLIEAPAFRVPTVNVGPRQDGRMKAQSVIDCAEDEASIIAAIERALSPEHADVVKTMVPPYGTGSDASRRIAEVLVSIPLQSLTKKRFFDVDFHEVPRGS